MTEMMIPIDGRVKHLSSRLADTTGIDRYSPYQKERTS